MMTFLLAALVLTVLVAALLLPPLLSRASAGMSPVAETHHAIAVLREQLDDLKAEQAAGNLTAAEFGEAEDELKRRILEEHREAVSPDATALATSRPATKTAVALVLLLVLGGFALYGVWGNLLALQPELAQSAARQAAEGQQMTPEQIAGMVEKLAARLEANPDDPEGWLMLARAYKILDRPAEAAAAFARIEAVVEEDAGLLADYAEMLAMSSETRLNGKPRQLLEKALKLDPNNARALFLAGMAALEAGEKQEAAAYWEKLLPRVAPGSELHRLLTEQIGKIRKQ
ncbi:MAG: c-type cytochrome biogenesis protein CcmI [Zoogloeaceae bacterium]|jgi:cytochrome c-type biogenesis protein CcmH|nr:c-type cytochrome biogenesis protein CcmI [Zoogloeaceae bacterium]